jgi:hypothetical protein
MVDVSLEASLDYLSKRLVQHTALLEVFTITGTEADDGTLRPIPPSLDSLPVGILWFQGEQVDAGNSERTLDTVQLLIFDRGTDGGFGYSSLVPYLKTVRVLLRTDLTLGGHATRCLYRGSGQVYPEQIDNGQQYLVLPINLELLFIDNTDEYSD